MAGEWIMMRLKIRRIRGVRKKCAVKVELFKCLFHAATVGLQIFVGNMRLGIRMTYINILRAWYMRRCADRRKPVLQAMLRQNLGYNLLLDPHSYLFLNHPLRKMRMHR